MKRLRSPRLVGPVIEQYSALLKLNRVLDSLLWARSYHEAVEHLNSIPKWKDVCHFRVLVAHDWSLWIDSLLLNFEFGTTKRLLSHPFVASEPVLVKEVYGVRMYGLQGCYDGRCESMSYMFDGQ